MKETIMHVLQTLSILLIVCVSTQASDSLKNDIQPQQLDPENEFYQQTGVFARIDFATELTESDRGAISQLSKEASSGTCGICNKAFNDQQDQEVPSDCVHQACAQQWKREELSKRLESLGWHPFQPPSSVCCDMINYQHKQPAGTEEAGQQKDSPANFDIATLPEGCRFKQLCLMGDIPDHVMGKLPQIDIKHVIDIFCGGDTVARKMLELLSSKKPATSPSVKSLHMLPGALQKVDSIIIDDVPLLGFGAHDSSLLWKKGCFSPCLKRLDLSNCGLSGVLVALEGLHNVKELVLADNHTVSLPDGFTGEILETLDMSNCKGTRALDLRRFEKLTELNLEGTELQELRLPLSIKELNIGRTHLKELPGDVYKLSLLIHLDASYNFYLFDEKDTDPIDTGLLSSTIRELNISSTKTTKVLLRHMARLQSLNISNNSINSFALPPSLKKIDASKCRLKRWPRDLASCRELETLDVSYNPELPVPDAEVLPQSLRELDITGVEFEPAMLGHLSKDINIIDRNL